MTEQLLKLLEADSTHHRPRRDLGEAAMAQKPTRYPELTARLVEEFLDSDS